MAVGVLALTVMSCTAPRGPAPTAAAGVEPRPMDPRVQIVAKALEDKLNLMLATAQTVATK